MRRRTAERLIGAGVLALLFIIFIFPLLDDSQQTGIEITTSNIPPRPQVEFDSRLATMPTPEEVAPPPAPPRTSASAGAGTDGAASADGVAGAVASDTAGAAAGEQSPQPAAAPPGPNGWVVQVASLSRDNAEELNQRLRGAGYPSYIADRPVTNDGDRLYRVRVGPEVRRADAVKLQARLKKEMKLDGFVAAYP